MHVFAFESVLTSVIFFVMAGIDLFALIDALTRPAAGFVAADKLTKPAWLVILGLGLLTCLVLQSPLGILGIIGVIAAGVYLTDVRPAVASITRR